ncbi:Basic form of pathogenesis-related protein 1 [Heracleum sosnowskyi]|uniref:Basic form of pathogenesis-related protein 1 n=1 Tax=Heracleum sosnowskyi TaxID=360622 RepID=A0AAD8H3P6_9APIA|nr:Basic form of pathogenesis-related protein 1 [Heracleum sosnowskyi]
MYFYLLTFLTLATLFHHSQAQNSNQDFLDAHNAARSLVGVGPMTWDANVAEYASNYTKTRTVNCSLIHSSGPYGKNLAKGTGSFSGTAAVNMWVAEKSDYTYATNTCAANKVCGHYTQVVWKNSIRLGCARVLCANGLWWFITCSYDPPGNYIGQKPY